VLGEISAPRAELTKFVLGHSGDDKLLAAGVGALLAVGAKLRSEELAALGGSAAEHCQIPNHPSAHSEARDDCSQSKADLEKLDRVAKGTRSPGD
jgi:hypothetical protein